MRKYLVVLVLILALLCVCYYTDASEYKSCASGTVTIDVTTHNITIKDIWHKGERYDAQLNYDPVTNRWYLVSLIKKD